MVWDLAFAPDGRHLVSSHGDGALLVWDVAEREVVNSLGGHYGPVAGVAFSADGRRLASAGEDGSGILWDVATGRKLAVLVEREGKQETKELSVPASLP